MSRDWKTELVDLYMAGGEVAPILSKKVLEGIDPSEITAALHALDKASEMRKGQKSITDNEVIGIQTYGTLEQMKKNFTTKLMENGDTENIHLSDQRAKLYCMMNENKDLPLKGAPKIDIVKMGMIKQSGKDFN